MCSLLFQASIPPSYWVEALHASTYLQNRCPTKTLAHSTPFYALYGIHPTYDHLRVFGCRCYPNVSTTAARKLAPRSVACVFLGYSSDHKGYRCLDLSTNHLIISRHVTFDESSFPFSEDLTLIFYLSLMSHRFTPLDHLLFLVFQVPLRLLPLPLLLTSRLLPAGPLSQMIPALPVPHVGPLPLLAPRRSRAQLTPPCARSLLCRHSRCHLGQLGLAPQFQLGAVCLPSLAPDSIRARLLPPWVGPLLAARARGVVW